MSIKTKSIPVIDLFAGPGGLGEGFSSVFNETGERVFDIRLSIEMEPNAHKTLELRSFFRKFPAGKAPESYYELLRQKSEKKRDTYRKELFKEYPKEAAKAKEEAWCAELGGELFPPDMVDERIRKALNGENNWVLIGGPPCQAYSLVGRSRRQWKEELDNTDKRVHLYKEYLRIIAFHHPAVFVMENVKGLLSSKVNGERVFDLIKKDLKNPAVVFENVSSPKYHLFSFVKEPAERENGNPVYEKDTDFLIKAEKYGVPQKRHRVIILGIREDLNLKPVTLSPDSRTIKLKEVIQDLPRVRSGISKSIKSSIKSEGIKKRQYIKEVDSKENWESYINGLALYISRWNGFHNRILPSFIESSPYKTGSEYIPFKTPDKSNPLSSWYADYRLGGVCNHKSRQHLKQDLKRYFFASVFAKTHNRFPRLKEYEKYDSELVPEHKNALSGKFSDRFRVQLANEPATTITSHISKDGHYFIHYDPEQCRSFTVREAARVQTFPDNYLFCGSRTAQFHQVGNAVPPYLAFQIGLVVKKVVNYERNF